MPARRIYDRLPPDLLDIFQAYPFKQYQAAFQGTPRDRLAAYHLAQAAGEWAREEPEAAWFAVGEVTGRLHRTPTLAFAKLARSPWHCEILDRELYRLRPFLYRPDSVHALGGLLRRVLGEFRRAGGELLEVRVDASDLDAENALAAAGFHPLGTSVKLSAGRPHLRAGSANRVSGLRIEPIQEADLGPVSDIVRGAHVTSHFFNEPTLDAERVREMFVRWVERCARGLAERVLVARLGEQPVGFVTVMLNRAIAEYIGKHIGVIDFVAVHPIAQGKGIGSELLREGLRRLGDTAEMFEVRTELDNFPAIRTYTKLGFQLTSADRVWLLAAPADR